MEPAPDRVDHASVAPGAAGGLNNAPADSGFIDRAYYLEQRDRLRWMSERKAAVTATAAREKARGDKALGDLAQELVRDLLAAGHLGRCEAGFRGGGDFHHQAKRVVGFLR
jgi:hypothetical protein